MPTSYPGALDALTNPATTDPLTAPSHAGQHADANDAIEAIQAELGTDPAGTAATVAARLTAAESFVGARATNTAGTSIPNDVDTVVPFATEDFDSDAFHDLVTNNSRLTVPTGKAGKYLAVGQVALASAAGVNRHLYLRKNGTTIFAFHRSAWSVTATWWGNVSGVIDLATTDYVELLVNQNSGAAVALQTTAGYNSLALTRLGS